MIDRGWLILSQAVAARFNALEEGQAALQQGQAAILAALLQLQNGH